MLPTVRRSLLPAAYRVAAVLQHSRQLILPSAIVETVNVDQSVSKGISITAKEARHISMDKATLARYSQALAFHCKEKPTQGNPRGVPALAQARDRAAVLVPLCTVEGEASVLFTVRAGHLRKHRGEVSFPGGGWESIDASLEATALRETREEIGVDTTQEAVIGALPKVRDKSGHVEVSPFVAHIGEVVLGDLSINPEEVAETFAVSFRHLLDEKLRTWHRFPVSQILVPAWRCGPHVVWGMTAYILHDFLRCIVVPDIRNYRKDKHFICSLCLSDCCAGQIATNRCQWFGTFYLAHS